MGIFYNHIYYIIDIRDIIMFVNKDIKWLIGKEIGDIRGV